MNYRRKLKPISNINIYLPAIFSWTIFLAVFFIFGKVIALFALGIILVVFGGMTLIPYSRTKNSGFLVSSIYLFILSLFVFTIPPDLIFNSSGKNLPPFSGLLLVVILIMVAWLIYLTVKRKLKWRGSEIYELAAANISESMESYTPRPRPIVKLDYTKSELREFGDFLKRNLISLAFIEDARIVFVPIKNGEEVPLLYKLNIDYKDRTWVAFDFEGNVSVNIAKRDYLYYKDDLAFDELCDSLGKLYLEFFELFRKGNEVRIIDQMNELKVGLFT